MMIAAAWAGTVSLILAGWVLDSDHLGLLGLAGSALAAALTIIRDNVRTRRMVRACTREVIAADRVDERFRVL